MDKKENILFPEYKYRRASTDIADVIREAILSDKFKEGDQLPPERDLAAQFHVGRMTIREALRTLETKGLITIKKGGSGGAFVQPAPLSQIAEIVMDNLQLDGVTAEEVVESRIVLERGIVKYVIKNANSEDLKRIERNIEETKPMVKAVSHKGSWDFIKKLVDFHRLLAQSAHIAPLMMFHRALAEWAYRRFKYWNPTEEQRSRSYLAHREIFEMIKKKDIKLCQERMERHIREVIDTIESHVPD